MSFAVTVIQTTQESGHVKKEPWQRGLGIVLDSCGETQKTKHLLIVTDAWQPQVNGVVQTYLWLGRELPKLAMDVVFLAPDRFKTVAMPTYPEIRLSIANTRTVGALVENARADYIHIATEGPLGWLARRYCLKAGRDFTTCYHTRYPEYIAARFPIPLAWTYSVMRRFHNSARATLAATDVLRRELSLQGFERVRHWLRGIDVDLFRDGPVANFDLPRPWFLFVGRLAVEKNISAFLQLELPGSKIVAGSGPARAQLQKQFPGVSFLGELHGDELASVYRAADVFVFPSRTDTYGLVMAEALAAGTPVAAYPGAGAQSIFGGAQCGIVDEDLKSAAMAALHVDRDICRATGARHSMAKSAQSFVQLVRAAHAVGMDVAAPV